MSSQKQNLSQKRIAAAISKSLSQVKYKRGESLIGKRSMPKKKAFVRANKTSGVLSGVIVDGPQGPERKKWDVNVGFTAVGTAAPYITSILNNIQQGTDANNRIGDRIHVKAVDFQFNNVASSSAAPTFMDIFLVWDKQPDRTIASVTDIFNTGTTNLTYQNIINLERFQIMKRERINMDSGAGLSTTTTWHQSCEMATRYGGTSSPFWPTTNDLLVVALCPGVAGGTSGAQISFTARVTFTDE